MIRQIGHAGQRNFPTTLVGKKSSLLTVLLTNVGNDDLNVSNQILEGNNPGDFTPDPDTTSCTWKASLPPGQSCQLGFSFSPKAAGLRTAYVTFVDNTATFQNTLYLNGVGLAAPVTPTIAIVSPMSGAQYYNGVNIPVTVTVGNNIGPIYTPPTGTVTLTVTNIATSVVAGTYGPFNLAPIAGASKSSINTPLTGLAVGKYSIAAAYSGDSLDTAITSGAVPFNVVQVTPTVTITAPASSAMYYPGSGVPVTVTISNAGATPAAPASPTGTVTLTLTNLTTNAKTTVGPLTLAEQSTSVGAAGKTITGLTAATYNIVAAYSGDTIDTSATSSVASFKVVPVIPTITWPTPSFVYVGTKLSSTQLDATAAAFGASLPGTFVYTPPGRNRREYAGDIPAQGGLYPQRQRRFHY